MVHSSLLTADSFAADLQRMSKQLAPGTILAPTWVELRTRGGEERLHWCLHMDRSGNPIAPDDQYRQVSTGRNFLKRFLKLADAPSEKIERFAQRFGVLALCQEHELPVSHQEGCPPSGFPDDCYEPLRLWRAYAGRMRAIHDIARALRFGNRGVDSNWWLLYPHWKPHLRFENVGIDKGKKNWQAHERREQLVRARRYLSEQMDELLKLGKVKLQLEWQRTSHAKGVPQPARWVVRLRYGHWLNLFGALVVQLLLEVCDTGEEVYLCSGCGKSYTREGRRANASQDNYCPACQGNKVPQQQADLRRRQRMREARLLHRDGVPLNQIARRLQTKPEHVARWLKKRVRKASS